MASQTSKEKLLREELFLASVALKLCVRAMEDKSITWFVPYIASAKAQIASIRKVLKNSAS